MKHLSKLFLFALMAFVAVGCGDDDDYEVRSTQLSHTYEIPVKGFAGNKQTEVKTTLTLGEGIGYEIADNLKSAEYHSHGAHLKINGLNAYGTSAEINGIKVRIGKQKEITLGDCKVMVTGSGQVQSDIEVSSTVANSILQGLFKELTTSSGKKADVYLTYTTNMDTETDKPIDFEFTLIGMYLYKVYDK